MKDTITCEHLRNLWIKKKVGVPPQPQRRCRRLETGKVDPPKSRFPEALYALARRDCPRLYRHPAGHV